MGTPMLSAQRLLMGRVAELEQVPKALRAAGMTFVKNSTTPYRPSSFTMPP